MCLLSSLQGMDVLFDVSFHYFGSIYKIEVLLIEKKIKENLGYKLALKIR